jgi:hypothetical protein
MVSRVPIWDCLAMLRDTLQDHSIIYDNLGILLQGMLGSGEHCKRLPIRNNLSMETASLLGLSQRDAMRLQAAYQSGIALQGYG